MHLTPIKTKKQTTILVLSVLLFWVMAANSEGKGAARQNGKPNVLFIAIDDLNDWTGMLKGNPQAKTPHMDQPGFQRDGLRECALRGAGLRSFHGLPS